MSDNYVSATSKLRKATMLNILKQAVVGAGDAIRRKPKEAKRETDVVIKTKEENSKKLEHLLAEDLDLTNALERSKNSLYKSASQETLNIIFGHKPRPPLSITDTMSPGDVPPLQPVDGDPDQLRDNDPPLKKYGLSKAHDAPLEPVDPLAVTPLDQIFPSIQYTKEDIVVLRGVLGYNEHELGDHAARLGRSLYVQRREKCDCDAKLVIAGQKIVGHQIVFAAFSAVLAHFYGGSTPEQAELMARDLESLKVNSKALKMVFGWMYTGKINVGEYNADIRDIAEQLGVKTLLKALDEQTTYRDNHRSLELKPSSEGTFFGIESSPAELTAIIVEAAKKIGENTSADELVSKIREEVAGEVINVDHDGPQAAIVIPPTPLKYESDEFYSAYQNLQLFLSMSPERIFLLLSSDYIRVRSEYDIYEAAVKWLMYSYYERKKYLHAMMTCPRWAYLTVQDIVRLRNLDTHFFHHKIVNRNVCRAKWYQDLLARGVAWKDYVVPANRLLG